MQGEALLRTPVVMARTGYSRPTIYRLMKMGAFPRPVRLNDGGAVAWRSSEIDEWIASRERVAA